MFCPRNTLTASFRSNILYNQYYSVAIKYIRWLGFRLGLELGLAFIGISALQKTQGADQWSTMTLAGDLYRSKMYSFSTIHHSEEIMINMSVNGNEVDVSKKSFPKEVDFPNGILHGEVDVSMRNIF